MRIPICRTSSNLIMSKPRLYFVDGTVVAIDGEHLFKNVVCGFGSDIQKFKSIADVIELYPNQDGIYYLQKEGCDSDYGESYLLASHGVTASGCKGQGGSIGAILSPIRSYNEYVESIQAIKDLLTFSLDYPLSLNLQRLLFIGVCGELEGYLSSTIIALIQGVREVFLSIKNHVNLPDTEVEYKLRDALVERINDRYQFQHIRNRDSKERIIYERLIGQELMISKELIGFIEWRNKLAHKVPFFSYPTHPRKEDVLSFINQANALVDYIDNQIEKYKEHWLKEF